MANEHPPLSTHDDRPDWEVLARYLVGESPAAEARAVAEWLGNHSADAELLAALDGAVGRVAAPRPEPHVDVEAALRRVKERRESAEVVPLRPAARSVRRAPTAPVSRRRLPIDWRVGGLAAAAAALLAVGVARWRAAGPPDEGVRDVAARTVVTNVGERDSLRLPDGSQVVLAPASRLVVTDFGRARREVQLQGAAWFAVRHDEARPFTVRAGGAVIQDIGTAFAVRTDGDSGVAVAVTEGVVALRAVVAAASGDTGVVLAAGDRGVLRAGGRVSAVRGGVTEADTAWRQGRLVYRDASLDQVVADLRRWYGVELRVADASVAGRHLTATFEAGDPVERVLDVIALAVGAELDRQGTVAVLRSARPARAARP